MFKSIAQIYGGKYDDLVCYTLIYLSISRRFYKQETYHLKALLWVIPSNLWVIPSKDLVIYEVF